MGMRKYKRSVAKGRMAEMGIDHINRRFSYGMTGAMNRRLQRTNRNKMQLLSFREGKKPIWWNVLYGDLAQMYERQKNRRKKRALN